MSARLATVALASFVLAASCTGGIPETEPPEPGGSAPPSTIVEVATTAPAVVDHPHRTTVVAQVLDRAPTPEGIEPPGEPSHLAEGVIAAPNQFWTSLIAADGPRRLWLTPLAAEIGEEGLTLARPRPAVVGDDLVAEWQPELRVVGDYSDYEVVGYGDFSVSIELQGESGTLQTTMAQGHPAVSLRHLEGGALEIEVVGEAAVTDTQGRPLTHGGSSPDAVVVHREHQTWTIAVSDAGTWEWTGSSLLTQLAPGGVVSIAADPDDAAEGWTELVRRLATSPIDSTIAGVELRPGVVQQSLGWTGDAALERPVALLPHHVAGLDGDPEVLGSYASVYGPLHLVAAQSVTWDAPLPGLLHGWPRLEVAPDVVSQAMAEDMSRREPRDGSYFGATDLHAEVVATAALAAMGEPVTAHVDPLIAELIDRLSWNPVGDETWLYYDEPWRTHLTAKPEFGSERFNDRHFHHGYLLSAAAQLERLRPGSTAPVSEELDALAAGLLAAGSPSASHWDDIGAAAPGGGVFSPYLGHSFADGLALSNRGNNQESSSEAVAAWAALAQWGAVSDRAGLLEAGLSRYAIESLTAQSYWLADPARPLGIVWGSRAERRTFFSGRPEAIAGIQLLPFTPASLYRTTSLQLPENWLDPAGEAPMWWDLFLMDDALSDPAGAADALRQALGSGQSEGAHHGHTWLGRIAWAAMLEGLGPPEPAIVSWPPFGRGFTGPSGTTLVAINPTSRQMIVGFWHDGTHLGDLTVPPRDSVERALPDPTG